MKDKVIAIIGTGNMGKSLMAGLLNNGISSENLWVSDPSTTNLNIISKQFGVHVTSDNIQAASVADVIILSVKPQIISKVANELSTLLQTNKPLIISVAAGVRVTSLEQWLGKHLSIVRVMPNTPALLGCGASALYANSSVLEDQRELAESILRAVGLAVWLDHEKELDTVTALSGCGPAYFFLLMEALQEAAENLGLKSNVARLLTLQTAFGAARMALESNDTPAVLRKRVTSPGGTTEQAIKVLEAGHVRQLFSDALIAAKKRSEELAQIVAHSQEG